MQHPSQDHYEQIDSPSHNQSSHPNHACSQPRSCNSDGETPTLGQPHSTTTLLFDDSTQTKDESLFSNDKGDSPTTALRGKIRSYSVPPPLPPKPATDYQNVVKVRGRMASDSQSYNNDHQRTPPPQSSTAQVNKAKDQRRCLCVCSLYS